MFPERNLGYSPISPTSEQLWNASSKSRSDIAKICRHQLSLLISRNSIDQALVLWILSDGELLNIVSRINQMPSQIEALVASFDDLSNEGVALVIAAADYFQNLFVGKRYKSHQSLYLDLEIKKVEEALTRVSQMTNQ